MLSQKTFSEANLNRLGWKIVPELSGDRTIKDTYTATGTKGNVGTYSKTTNYGSIDDYLENITGSRDCRGCRLVSLRI